MKKINCIIVDDEPLALGLVESYVLKTPFLELKAKCLNAFEAMKVITEEKIDLIFLDVEMPEMSGFDLIKIIPDPKPQIIMITSNREYAPDAFDFNVTDFIVKPVNQERFLKAVAKAKKIADNNFASGLADHDIFVKVNSLLVKLNTRDILYIESLADYIIIHTDSAKYTVHHTMKGIETKLPSGYFMRVHNSFIVRLDKIINIDENLIVIQDKLIPISRANKSELMNRLKVI